jgi:hypothetical protein
VDNVHGTDGHPLGELSLGSFILTVSVLRGSIMPNQRRLT